MAFLHLLAMLGSGSCRKPAVFFSGSRELASKKQRGEILDRFARFGPESTKGLPPLRAGDLGKLSEQLLRFAHPVVGHLHHHGDDSVRESGIRFAILAWNAAVTEDAVRDIAAMFEQTYGRSDVALSDGEFWAPLNAWRVLRCLAAPEALEPLLSRLDDLARSFEEDHRDDFTKLCSAIGAPALPFLAPYLGDPAYHP